MFIDLEMSQGSTLTWLLRQLSFPTSLNSSTQKFAMFKQKQAASKSIASYWLTIFYTVPQIKALAYHRSRPNSEL